MKTSLLIAGDSIKALLHHRALLALMLVSLALTAIFSIVSANFQAMETKSFEAAHSTDSTGGGKPVTEEEQRKLRQSLEMANSTFEAAFYQVASFGGSVVALFIFSTAVSAEIRKGTIRVTLSKPVSRPQYLLGKYLGGVAVMLGYALVATAAMVFFTKFEKLDLGPVVKFAPWLMFCRQLMLGSLAMLLSLFMHPLLASVLAFFAGNGLYSPPNPLYYLLPSYSPFNFFVHLLAGTVVSGRDVLILSAYALDFIVIMLLLALWRFKTKELV